MKKRVYAKPVMESETFVPQNYIAACGEENKVYKFVCNAGPKSNYDVYVDANCDGEYQKGIDYKLDRTYTKCGTVHYAKTTDQFLCGLMYPGTIKVKIWRGENGNDIHCTENILQETWETVKS